MKTETKIETTYEVMLRQQDERELIVDVRTTVEDENGDEILDDYVEGFSFTEPTEAERYREARREFNRLLRKYADLMVEEEEKSEYTLEQNGYTLVENDQLLEDAKQLVAIKEEEDAVAILTVG